MMSDSSYLGSQSSFNQTAGYILTDEKSFYYQFKRDLALAEREVIIESPFITTPRLDSLKNAFESLVERHVRVFVITRHPEEHHKNMADQSEAGIRFFENLGVQVLMCWTHHRKIAMIDRKIIWKGSLNILSHRDSREFMEREEDIPRTKAMYSFLGYAKICVP